MRIVAREMESAGTSDFLAGFDALAQAVRRARGANGRARGANGRGGGGNGGALGANGTGSGANGARPDAGLTLSQYGLLELLVDRQSARVQELAAHAGITPSTATRILDALQRRGVVERTRSDEDRRAVAVSLTEAGRQVVHAEQEWLRGRQRTFYAALPGAEQELAPDLLFQLAALIDELAAGPDQEP
ncbi:MAG: MarR family winged helix-turn-helix transcriptional regulator [Solirubrobacteraceae bacterium]